MQQRTILITGCSSGIGLVCARGLRARGWQVLTTARSEDALLALRAEGFAACFLELRDSASVQACAAWVQVETGGRLHALFNNAGYGQPGAVEDLSPAVVEAQFQANCFGPWQLTNALLPLMRAQGNGRIVFNSSLLGWLAMPYRGAYNASKFALEAWAATLRQELVGSGVSVILIEPGPIASNFRANSLRAFTCNIQVAHSAHQANYTGLLRRLSTPGPANPFTGQPELVLRALLHALEARRPRAHYPVTLPAHVFAWVRRCLPVAWQDAWLRYLSQRENR